jgi:long-chain acyl-CoA synthetase
MAGEASYASKPWLKSYDKGVPEKIKYEEICMPDILDRSAAKFPDRMALSFQGYNMTYKALKDMVERFATCLAGMGVKKGEKIPAKKLAVAAKKPGKMGQRARLAQTLSKLKK